MNGSRIRRLAERLRGRPTVLGRWMRRRAARALARDGSPQAAAALARALLDGRDPDGREVAGEALRSVVAAAAIDGACAVWAETRRPELLAILRERSWTARAPSGLRVLSALAAGRGDVLAAAGAEEVDALLEAAGDRDPDLARAARAALGSLGSPEARERLCAVVVERDDAAAREAAVEAGYEPRDAARRALFYFLTEQWDKYEALDLDRGFLVTAYGAAGERGRRRIRAIARRAGRREWVEVVAGGRRGLRLADMTDGEWETAIAVLAGRRGWEEMWRLAQDAPPRWSAVLIGKLAAGGWRPPEGGAGFDRLAALAGGWREEDVAALVGGGAVLKGHRGPVSAVAAGAGPTIASASGESVRIWSAPDGRPFKALEAQQDVASIAVSPDGGLLAAAGGPSDRNVCLWSLPGGKGIGVLEDHPPMSAVGCLAFGPDARLLATGSADGGVRLWRIPECELAASIPVPREAGLAPVRRLVAGGDGLVLAAARAAIPSVQLITLPEGHAWKELEGHTAPILCAEAGPEGLLLATGSADATVRLWALPEGDPAGVLVGHADEVRCLAFAPGGRLLATGGFDRTVRLWSLPEGKEVACLRGHPSHLTCLAAAGAGGILASGGGGGLWEDAAVRLWGIGSGKHLATLTGHGSWVTALAAAPDGRWLASASQDKTVRLWDLTPLRAARVPVRESGDGDLAWIDRALAGGPPAGAARRGLEFIAALLRHHRAFDILIEDARPAIEVGEFDIEIDG